MGFKPGDMLVENEVLMKGTETDLMKQHTNISNAACSNKDAWKLFLGGFSDTMY